MNCFLPSPPEGTTQALSSSIQGQRSLSFRGGGGDAVDGARIPQEAVKRLPRVRLAVTGDRFR